MSTLTDAVAIAQSLWDHPEWLKIISATLGLGGVVVLFVLVIRPVMTWYRDETRAARQDADAVRALAESARAAAESAMAACETAHVTAKSIERVVDRLERLTQHLTDRLLAGDGGPCDAHTQEDHHAQRPD
jgi:uncharacterized membrane protein YcjF (UPF0283 family)